MTQPIRTKFHQVPHALLDSDRSGLAIATWCLYEALSRHSDNPAYARRSWMAAQFGVSESTLDRARAELLADDGAGPFLAREVRGRNRSALHFVLGRPQETGEPYARIPAWNLNRVYAGPGRINGYVSADTWRTYAILCDRLGPDGHELTHAKLAEWQGCSVSTSRRRIHELETVGWIAVQRRSGLWSHIGVIADAPQPFHARDLPAHPELHGFVHVKADPQKFLSDRRTGR